MTTETTKTVESELAKAADNALYIIEGACNPRGTARALVEAIDAACDMGQGHAGAKHAEYGAPIRIILCQLAQLLGVYDPYGNDAMLTRFSMDTEPCKKLAAPIRSAKQES